MDQYFSAKELAGIAGMPETESALIRKAKKEKWPSRQRSGRGGGREYPLSCLPETTRMALSVQSPGSKVQGPQNSHPSTAKIIPLYNKEGNRRETPPFSPPNTYNLIAATSKPIQISNLISSSAPEWASRIALARVDLVRAFVAEREAAKLKCQSVTSAAQEFVAAYNSGLILPKIKATLGDISVSSIYGWEKTFREASYDFNTLIPEWGKCRRGTCSVTEAEKNYILSFCLHQNQVKIGTAINLTKHLMERRGILSPSHPSTIRRFVESFKKSQYDKWVLAREGEKALRDKVAPYLERDDRFLSVGDVLVGDGHRCNFKVIHPFTGKPCRPALIGFFDWASRVMVGWSIMVEENVQAIAAALRHAILKMGKIPKYLYLDNGKAFKARVFTHDIDLEECGVYGMFVRLGIHTAFAWPYNARSKPIERFFGTLSNTFERLLPSFSGASIDDRPASERRNEKYMQEVFGQKIPTIQQANEWLSSWQHYYMDMPHPTRHIAGGVRLSRGQILRDGLGAGVDPQELTYMMLSMEIRTIRQNGIHFMGRNYWNENLYGLKDRVVIKYDFSDLSYVYIYSQSGEYMGRADRIEPVHPMAALSDNPDQSYSSIKQGIKEQKSLVKETKKIVKLAITQGRKEAIDQLPWNEMIQVVPGLPEKIEQLENELSVQGSRFEVQGFEDETEVQSPTSEVENSEKNFGTEPRFEYPFERYEWLINQVGLTMDQKSWMDDYRIGRIFPGEWQMMYGPKKRANEAIFD